VDLSNHLIPGSKDSTESDLGSRHLCNGAPLEPGIDIGVYDRTTHMGAEYRKNKPRTPTA